MIQGGKRGGSIRRSVVAHPIFVVALVLSVFFLGSYISLSGVATMSRGEAPTRVLHLASGDSSRIVSVKNHFGFDVALLYEDGHSVGVSTAIYLTDIASGQTAKISVTDGVEFFATEADDHEGRIAEFAVKAGVNDYKVGSTNIGRRPFVKAYIDVDFRERPHPDVTALHQPPSTAMSAKFRNLSNRKVDFYYDDGRGGTAQGHLRPGQETTTNTYEGHEFFFTEAGRKDKDVARFAMRKDESLYVLHDEKNPAPRAVVEMSAREEAFMEEYFRRTGILWRHFFGPDGPRAPPVLHMWPARRVGAVHRVVSREGFWTCDGSSQACQAAEGLDLELECISVEPRAFVIKNFLSGFEVDEIVKNAKPNLRHSSVGDAEAGILTSDTRTSSNTWVKRTDSAVTESLFLRAADLLQIDEKLLTRKTNAEDLQVVHYKDGQKYDSHHDWGVSGYAESRFITLLLYLTDMEGPDAGGETSFPKAAGGQGIKVHPGKGSAVLFYNLLEDGNGDDLALHAALPIHKGEKWLANFWVWDPIKNS